MFRLILIFLDEINISLFTNRNCGLLLGKTLSEKGESIKTDQNICPTNVRKIKSKGLSGSIVTAVKARKTVLSPALHSALKSHHSQTTPK